MIDFSFISSSPEETEAAGERLGSELKKRNIRDAFIAMYGDLGAGKTCFVRGMARVLTPDAFVCSPTYAIVNEYRGDNFAICHFDMYRIESDDDLYSVGFYDYRDCIIVAEWSENIPFAIPENHIRVRIDKTDDDKRKITVKQTEDTPK